MNATVGLVVDGTEKNVKRCRTNAIMSTFLSWKESSFFHSLKGVEGVIFTNTVFGFTKQIHLSFIDQHRSPPEFRHGGDMGRDVPAKTCVH
jgi:hypothetical protein